MISVVEIIGIIVVVLYGLLLYAINIAIAAHIHARKALAWAIIVIGVLNKIYTSEFTLIHVYCFMQNRKNLPTESQDSEGGKQAPKIDKWSLLCAQGAINTFLSNSISNSNVKEIINGGRRLTNRCMGYNGTFDCCTCCDRTWYNCCNFWLLNILLLR